MTTTPESTSFTKIPHQHKALPDDLETKDTSTRASKHREEFEEAVRRAKWMPSNSQPSTPTASDAHYFGDMKEGKTRDFDNSDLPHAESGTGSDRLSNALRQPDNRAPGTRVLKDGKWVKQRRHSGA
jgi:hypothetical protein